MNGLARSEPVIKSASLTAIITMALRYSIERLKILITQTAGIHNHEDR